MEGWIKLHRKLLKNPIVCKDGDHLAVWVYLLLNATHKEYPSVFKGEKVFLKPGQLITGRKSISKELRVHESKVQRILTCFENEHQIEQLRGNNNRLISIVSWDEYQTSEQLIEHEMNIKRTTDEQLMNTNKNVKNKRIKEKDNTFSAYTSNTRLIETLESFLESRKKIKSPMTDKAVKLLLSSLDKLTNDEEEKIAILEQSIINGWKGVFPLKTTDRDSYSSKQPVVDKTLELRRIDIARNKWISGGNDPSEFRYDTASSS